MPAHTVLHLPTMINQRDPAWWSEPERFDPDRFAPPRSEQRRHPMCFHPFGSGAHKCIGMHFADMTVKAFLHRFVQVHDPPPPPTMHRAWNGCRCPSRPMACRCA